MQYLFYQVFHLIMLTVGEIRRKCGAPELHSLGETEVLAEKLSQCHLAYHRSHMYPPGIEPRPLY
jgi:hypothetical protein